MLLYIITEGCESRRLGQLQALDIDEGNNAEITYFVYGNERVDSNMIDEEKILSLSIVQVLLCQMFYIHPKSQRKLWRA